MALTAKPISTISYNTESFILDLMRRLFEANKIEDYRLIYHHGEDGDKDHWHVLMYPNRRLDTGLLRSEFNEIPKTGDMSKPLGCLPIRQSKPDHWLMYVLHDPVYLKNHKSDNDGDGKIPYQLDDIKTPFRDQLDRDYRKAIALRNTNNQEVMDRIKQGQTADRIIYETNIRPNDVLAIYHAVQISQNMPTLEEAQKIKEDYLKQIEAATRLTGEVKMIEELPQLKAEKKKGVFSRKVQTYHMNMATGELVADPVKVETIEEEEDKHGLWEGLEKND